MRIDVQSKRGQSKVLVERKKLGALHSVSHICFTCWSILSTVLLKALYLPSSVVIIIYCLCIQSPRSQNLTLEMDLECPRALTLWGKLFSILNINIFQVKALIGKPGWIKLTAAISEMSDSHPGFKEGKALWSLLMSIYDMKQHYPNLLPVPSILLSVAPWCGSVSRKASHCTAR